MDKPIIFSTNMVKAILSGRKTQTRRAIKDGKLTYMTETGEINKGLNSPPYKLPKGTTMWRKMKPIYPEWGYRIQTEVDDCRTVPLMCPYGKPGDILWVRETWRLIDFQYIDGDWSANVQYRDSVTGARIHYLNRGADEKIGWRPSIHMPREASRIRLLVKRVGVERVQDITEEDAKAEGVPEDYPVDPIYCPTCGGGGAIGIYNRTTLGYMDVDCSDCDTAVNRYKNLWDSINAKRGFGWATNPWVWVIEFEVI